MFFPPVVSTLMLNPGASLSPCPSGSQHALVLGFEQELQEGFHGVPPVLPGLRVGFSVIGWVAWSSCSSSQCPWAGTGDAVARLLWLMTAGSIPSLAMLISVVVFSR